MGQEQSVTAGSGNIISSKASSGGNNSVKHDVKLKAGSIVTVSTKKTETEHSSNIDIDLENIRKIKLIRPILNNGLESDHGQLPRLPASPFTEMLLRYQIHLTECAEAVSIDQSILVKRIKEVDGLSASINKKLNERQKSFNHAAAQFSMINDLVAVVTKMDVVMQNTIVLFENLNQTLPVGDQISSDLLEYLPRKPK